MFYADIGVAATTLYSRLRWLGETPRRCAMYCTPPLLLSPAIGTPLKSAPRTSVVSEREAVSANSGNGEVTLSWTDPSNSDLDRIEITWGPAQGESQPKNVSAGNASTGVSASAPAADVSTLISEDTTAGLTGVQGAGSAFGDPDGDTDLDLVIASEDSTMVMLIFWS